MLFRVTMNYGIKRHMKLNVTHKEQSDWIAMNVALGTKVECAADIGFFFPPRAKKQPGHESDWKRSAVLVGGVVVMQNCHCGA